MATSSKAKTSTVLNQAKELLLRNELLLTRSALAAAQLDGKKDINKSCGYPNQPENEQYRELYKREGIAKRVVNIYPEECWNLDPEIVESQKPTESKFEAEWLKLEEQYNLYHYLQRIDKLSGVGEFGILLIGIDDKKTLELPVDGVEDDDSIPSTTKSGSRKILYLRALDRSVVTIDQYEQDTASPRYGKPTIYSINFQEVREGATAPQVAKTKVHWTRVLHVADECENSEVFGTPRMEKVLNRLLDLRKILGGSGEMFWKGGFPGISFETPSGTDLSTIEIDTKGLRAEMDAYENGLQRYIAAQGMNAKSLAPQVADPGPHIETQIKAICISLGCPYRIFVGSEQAQLASGQDSRAWNKRLKGRQEKYVSPRIVTPFLRRLMHMGVITWVDEFFVVWPDLNTLSDEEIATIAEKRTKAISLYTSSGSFEFVPPMEFLTLVLKFTKEEADAIIDGNRDLVDFSLAEEDDEEETTAAAPASKSKTKPVSKPSKTKK